MKTGPIAHRMEQHIPIEPGLEMREITLDEAKLFFDLVSKNHSYISRWISAYEDMKKPEDCIALLKQAEKEKAAGKQCGYGIFQNARVIGRISLYNMQEEPEMCYWVDEAERGKGIATKAVRTITTYGLRELNLPRIMLRIDRENDASNEVARKAGYLVRGFQGDRQGINYLWKIYSWEQDAINTVRQQAACAQGYGMVYNTHKW